MKKLKKGTLIGLYNSMSEIKKQLSEGGIKSTKVYYPISRNLKSIENEIRALTEVDPTIISREFENERIKIVEEKAKKDDKGVPIMTDNKYEVDDNLMEELEEDIKNLWDTKFSTAYEEASRAFGDILQEEVDIDLLGIHIEDLVEKFPELSVEVIDALTEIIKTGGEI